MDNYWKKRRQARKYIEKLLEKQSQKCYDCERIIYPIRRYLKQGWKLITAKRDIAILEKEGIKTEFIFATIEHIQPLCEGGQNNIDNLIALCIKCNLLRDHARAGRVKAYKTIKNWSYPKINTKRTKF